MNRRRFLVGAALAASAAGCTSLGDDPDEGRQTVPAAALASVVDEAPPAAPRTVPVDIQADYLDRAAETARGALRTVPTPLTADHVPNGAIRRDVVETGERARSYLDHAESAASPYEALRALYRARGTAREQAAAWAAVDAGLTRERVLARGPTILEDVDALEARRSYVGDDPVDATLVHAVVEDAVDDARANASVEADALERPENPLTVGELAGQIARARAAVDDATYLFARFEDGLADPTDLHRRIQLAAGRLDDAVGARHDEAPSVEPHEVASLVDADVEGTPAEEALETLYWRVRSPDGPASFRADGRPALAIRLAHDLLAAFRAFDSLRGRIDGGDTFVVDTAVDVDIRRREAIDAVADLEPATALTSWERATLADRLRDADGYLADRGDGPVDTSLLDRPVAEYVVVDELARALPAAGERMVSALRD